MSTMGVRALALALALAAGACGKGDPAASGGGSAGGSAAVPAADSGPRAAVLAAWTKGGLTASPLGPATTPVGKDCQSGTVNAIDVLLCVFPSATEAKAAEDAGLAWVGDATGASQAAGVVLIAIADRRKSDPSGRSINQMMKLSPR